MQKRIYSLIFILSFLFSIQANAQEDRKEVRSGNRSFNKERYSEAQENYNRALSIDSLSFAANYNLANTLYRMEDYAQASTFLNKVKESAPDPAYAADCLFNLGDAALMQKDYQTAVDAFAQSLVLRPDDLLAKENYVYAMKMLQSQQNQNDQNQNDQNNDDQNDQNQNDQNQDGQGDENQDDENQDDQNQNNQNNQDNQNDQNQNDDKKEDQEARSDRDENQQISPQAAQQMLQAIQAKEKETQDKVNKKKAEALKSRMKEKNW